MHKSVMQFVGEKVREYKLEDKKVLEVGSLDVNGTVRDFFSKEIGQYIGLDIRAGKGVDVVCNAHEMKFDDALFDVVLSTEMLEHDDMFWLSVMEMGRVLKPDGYLILTARGNGFQQHAFPSDYYRFIPEAFQVLFKLAGCAPLEIKSDPEVSGVFGIGIRKMVCF